MTARVNPVTPEGSLPFLRAAARIALVVGAAGSVGLMLAAGRTTPRLLLILFVVWTVSPFVALAWAHQASPSWSVPTRVTLYCVTIAIALGTLAIYIRAAFPTQGAPSAAAFILVPPASWLLSTLALVTAAILTRRMSPLARRILMGVAALAMLGVLSVGVLLGSLSIERRTALTLPAPTGSFAVGRAIYDWKDDATLDTLAPTPGTKRELLVWIWYPSAAGQSVAMDDYVPAHIRAAAGPPSGPMALLTRDASRVHGHSMRNSDLSPLQASYPVVLMRAGASAPVVNYTTLAEDLASHGYVVVGFDAPYRTSFVAFPDGRAMRRTTENNPEVCLEKSGQEQDRCVDRVFGSWTTDMTFVLDRLAQLNSSDTLGRFTGRLDMTRVGVFGHSFGGAAAAQFCHDDARCKAGIDVDGAPHGSVIQAGLHQPFMLLLSDHSRESDSASRRIETDIQSLYNGLPANARLRIAIRGANHFTFSDDGALLKSRVVRRVLRVMGALGIDGRRQLAITTHCVHTFFDAYLKGATSVPPSIASPLYPEIQILE